MDDDESEDWFKLDYYDIDRSDPNAAPESWADGHLLTQASCTRPTVGDSVALVLNDELIRVNNSLVSGIIVAVEEDNPTVRGWECGAWIKLDNEMKTAALRAVSLGHTSWQLGPGRSPASISAFQELATSLIQASADGLVTRVVPHRRTSDGKLDAIVVTGEITEKGRRHLSDANTTAHPIPHEVSDPEHPLCCISYSWDSESHKTWVRTLADKLFKDGVQVRLDQYHLRPGFDLGQYMEQAIRESKHVLCICTPRFKDKSDTGSGGAGYEKRIITGEMITGLSAEGKTIPLLCAGTEGSAIPSFLQSRFFIDFRSVDQFELSYDELIRTIHDAPRHKPPPLGKKPHFKTAETPPSVSAISLAILQHLCTKSETGSIADSFVPVSQLSWAGPRMELEESLDELETKGYVVISRNSGGDDHLRPANKLFWDYDPRFVERQPRTDAIAVATILVESHPDGAHLTDLSRTIQWDARRLNPAVSFLVDNHICEASEAIGGYPFVVLWIRPTPRTRRFVKEPQMQ